MTNLKKINRPNQVLWSLFFLISLGGITSCNDRVVKESSTSLSSLSPSPISTDLPARLPVLIPPHSSQENNFVVSAVDKVGPAVVKIEAQREIKRKKNGFNQWFPEDFYERENPTPDRVEQGTGSGFLLSQDGQILTNAHVIDGADSVKVYLKDGRNFTGRVLGEDSVTDVAVVKIDATNLPSVSLGNSDQLQPGEWAIAIGNPLGLDNSVTIGIISATGRSSRDIGVPDKRVGFIQTDAAINPGNSGGPLLNAEGKIIGMNTAIIQGAQGLGFAIPINDAQRIAQQLITKGEAQHPYLGIEMITLTPEIKSQINQDPESGISLELSEGILVVRVIPNGPAFQGGMKAGDIIQSINTKTITKAEQVQQIVQNTQVGDSLNLLVIRQGKPLTLTVKLGNLPPRRQRSR